MIKDLERQTAEWLRAERARRREDEEKQRADAARLRAELRVLEAIRRNGIAWPGEY